MLNPFEDVIGEECYECEDFFPESDMSKIYISGLKELYASSVESGLNRE